MDIKKRVIHIFGASGSGTSTLGRAVAARTGFRCMDTDDYYWLPAEPMYTLKRPIPERLALMERDLDTAEDAVLSGSLVGWGGGDMHEQSQAFLDWAAQYDDGVPPIRSRALHDLWQRQLPCPLLTLDGTLPVEELTEMVVGAMIP